LLHAISLYCPIRLLQNSSGQSIESSQPTSGIGVTESGSLELAIEMANAERVVAL